MISAEYRWVAVPPATAAWFGGSRGLFRAGSKARLNMPATYPEGQHIALYAIGAALLIGLLQRLPFVGRIFRTLFSLALLAFFIFIVVQQAPYVPELSRLTAGLGLDDQQVAGNELRVRMASDG